MVNFLKVLSICDQENIQMFVALCIAIEKSRI